MILAPLTTRTFSLLKRGKEVRFCANDGSKTVASVRRCALSSIGLLGDDIGGIRSVRSTLRCRSGEGA